MSVESGAHSPCSCLHPTFGALEKREQGSREGVTVQGLPVTHHGSPGLGLGSG